MHMQDQLQSGLDSASNQIKSVAVGEFENIMRLIESLLKKAPNQKKAATAQAKIEKIIQNCQKDLDKAVANGQKTLQKDLNLKNLKKNVDAALTEVKEGTEQISAKTKKQVLDSLNGVVDDKGLKSVDESMETAQRNISQEFNAMRANVHVLAKQTENIKSFLDKV